MYLQKLSLLNFKNYPQAEFDFSPGINCFVGNNGVGKTNLLDAIYYLSLTKSFFNNVDTQHIRHGEDFFVVQGTFHREGQEENIYCSVQRTRKKQFKRNRKEYSRLADHVGLIPVVMISPADSSLITEGSEERRKFMDSVISQYDRVYLDDLIRYNRALVQRNSLLKHMARSSQGDDASLRLWDEQMIPLAGRIYRKREEFIEKLVPIFQQYYGFISGGKEMVEVKYESQLKEHDLRELLDANLLKDKILQYTTAGVHKDDLWLGLGDHPIKREGSQGQQKTVLVSLKMAKFGFIKQVCGFNPILLLDDIFDKFDSVRVTQIIRLVAEDGFGQIFITDTNLKHLETILAGIKTEHRIFRINQGVEELKEEG